MGLKISRPVQSSGGKGQKISLCMIMKDEEEYLARCLSSVKDVVSEIIIVDTGSTDRSVEIAEGFGAKIIHEPWRHDFAYHRNTSLDAATGDWILVLDADEEMVDQHALLPLLDDSEVVGYSFREINFVGDEEGGESVAHSAFRLFRNAPNHRYEGALHEQIVAAVDPGLERTKFLDLEILHYGYLNQTSEAKNKLERNMALALEEVKRKPKNAFVLFNAGTEFQRAGELETAVDYYSRAFSNVGSLSEAYVSLLLRNLVGCLGHLGRTDEALAVVDDAIEVFEGFTDLHYLKGSVLVYRHDYRAALESFETAIDRGDYRGPLYMAQAGTGSYMAFFAMGSVHSLMGNTAQAADCYRKALSSAKVFHRQSFARLTQIAIDAGDMDEAIRTVRALLPEKRRSDALHVAGGVFLGGGHFAEAHEMLSEALALEDTAHANRVGIAHSLIGMGRIEDAIEVVKQIPETSDSYWHGCSMLLIAGLVSKREDLTEEAISRGAPRLLPAMGLSWKLAAAAVHGHEAPEVPDDIDRNQLGAHLMDITSVVLTIGALDAFNAVTAPLMETAPDKAMMDETMGLVLYGAGFTEPAMECLVRAFQSGRELGSGSLMALGRICAEKGFTEDAEGLFRSAIDEDPEKQGLYLELVSFYVGQSRYSDAVEILDIACDMWPHSTVMAEVRDTLSIMASAVGAGA